MENAQPEPSMEEILASIRRIISEDDEDSRPEAAAPASTPAARPPAAPAREPESEISFDEAAGEDEAEAEAEDQDEPQTATDDNVADLHLETEDIEMISKSAAATMDEESEAILADTAAAAASQAFDSLSQTVRVSSGDNRTLEAIVIDILRPMVKEWLDANLPAIVEEKVEEEVQRLARRRR